MTITLKDAFGNPVSGTSVTFASTGSGNALTQPALTTDASGQAAGSFSSTKAEAETLSISSPIGLEAVQTSVTVNAGQAAKLAGQFSAANYTAVHCARLNITSEDSFGNASAPAVPHTIDVTSTGSGQFYSDSICTSVVTSYSQASATASVFYKSGIAEQVTATVTDTDASPLTEATTDVNFNYALTLTGPTSVASGACSGPYTITPKDDTGAARSYSTDEVLKFTGLTTTGYGAFFSSTDPTCTTPVTTTTLLSGNTSVDFYFQPIKAETDLIRASSNTSDPLVQSGALNVTVSGGPATALVLTGPSVISPGACSPAYTATLFDSAQNTTTSGSAIAVNLSASGTGGGTRTFYSNSACTTSATQITIPAASQSAQFYVKDTAAESLTLTAADAASILTQSTFNAEVDATTPALSVSVGIDHTCALLNGAVKCWGLNTYGELGDGTTNPSLVPVQAVGLTSGIVSIAAADQHTCALDSGGAVYCWGMNSDGRLGYASTDTCVGYACQMTPTLVPGMDSGVTAIAAGGGDTCAIKGGALYCWGGNSAGQIGDGTTIQRTSPTAVLNLTDNVTAVATYSSHTCAIRLGALYCWGTNGDGQLGYPAGSYNAAPTVVPVGATGATQVALGTFHSCALIGGEPQCWGVWVQTPSPAITSGVVKLISGDAYACALMTDGSVQCWGAHWDGNGDWAGPNTTVSAPNGLTPEVTDLSGAFHDLCFILGGRDVQCMSGNESLNAGNGSINAQPSPVSILSLF